MLSCRLKPEKEPPALTAAAEARAVKKLRRVRPCVALSSYASQASQNRQDFGPKRSPEVKWVLRSFL